MPHQKWSELIEQLESHDVVVASIVPVAVLVARGLSEKLGVGSTVKLFWASQGACDCIGFDSNDIEHWKRLSLTENAVSRYIRLHQDGESRCYVIAADTEVDLLRRAGADAERVANEATDFALSGARLALSGKWERWPDLRRDVLAPSDPLRPIAAQLKRLAFAMTIGCWRSGSRLGFAAVGRKSRSHRLR